MKRPVGFYCALFRRYVEIYHQWTEEDFKKFIKKNYKMDVKDIGENDGVTLEIFNGVNSRIILWTRKIKCQKEAVSTLAHEAVHVSSYIFDHAGVKVSTNNDETQAYYVGMIVKAALSS